MGVFKLEAILMMDNTNDKIKIISSELYCWKTGEGHYLFGTTSFDFDMCIDRAKKWFGVEYPDGGPVRVEMRDV
jgi:hypothetical protein